MSKVPKVPDYKLEAAQLQEELRKDRKGTQSKYDGKVLELSGTILSPPVGHGGRNVSFILESSAFRPDLGEFALLCIGDDPSLEATLGQGQTVRLRAIYNGRGGTLDHCEVVEKGPDTLIRLTAEDLAKEFTADRVEAAKIYDKKTLIMTGTISAITLNPSLKTKNIVLKGDDRTAIVCSCTSLEFVARAKVGDPVKFIGSAVNSGEGFVKVDYCHPLLK
ncbi:MAG: hypothetical protein JWO38_2779 [Gemmataceae bacterium]|nr:hypothetical protein [Gemmataceae bacterium]